jgi:hypothetical protein
MVTARHLGPWLALLAAASCFPGERPIAEHVVCDDGGCRCERGFDDCDGDPNTGCESPVSQDRDNCGACGNACHAACSNNTCSVDPCDAGFSDCNGESADGCEADFQNDPRSCGSCGHDCLGGGCAAGVCRPYELVDRGFFAATMAADDADIYFCELVSGTVMRAPLTGGDALALAIDQHCGFVDDDFLPGLMAVGGGHLYWTTGRYGYGFTYEEKLTAMNIASGERFSVLDSSGGMQGPCCSATPGVPGCVADPGIQACVCAQDDFCCTDQWDSLCVGNVSAFGCGACASPAGARAMVADDQSLLLATEEDGNWQLALYDHGSAAGVPIVQSGDALTRIAMTADHVYWVEPITPPPGVAWNTAIYRVPRAGGVGDVFDVGLDIEKIRATKSEIFWTARDPDSSGFGIYGGNTVGPLVVSDHSFFQLYVADEHVYWIELIGQVGIGFLKASIADGTIDVISDTHYVYSTGDNANVIVWADYTDRVYAVAK